MPTKRIMLFACLGLFGCDWLTGPEGELVIGVLNTGGVSIGLLEAPDSVAAGEDFTVVVSTLDVGCVRGAGARVRVEGQVATITPFDRETTPGEGQACAGGGLLPREVRLRLHGSGQGLLRLVGRRVVRGVDELMTIEQTIEITSP
jgi:hypothetical protein